MIKLVIVADFNDDGDQNLNKRYTKNVKLESTEFLHEFFVASEQGCRRVMQREGIKK